MKKSFILIISVLALIVLILLIDLVIFVEPSASPKNVLISNVTDQQATVSWLTDQATRGTILISESNKFPLAIIFARKSVTQQGFYTVHNINLTDLKPNINYNFRIYQGFRAVYQGNFQTGSTLEAISTPHPVFGKVKDEKSNPIVGAIVSLQLVSLEGTRSAILSTLSNREGGWTIDLANARTTDLQASFPYDEKITEEIIVERAIGRVKESTSSGKDQPWQDVILR